MVFHFERDKSDSQWYTPIYLVNNEKDVVVLLQNRASHFAGYINLKDDENLAHSWSNKSLKGTTVNQTCNSINEVAIENNPVRITRLLQFQLHLSLSLLLSTPSPVLSNLSPLTASPSPLLRLFWFHEPPDARFVPLKK